MVGIDLVDQIIHSYDSYWKSYSWFKKLASIELCGCFPMQGSFIAIVGIRKLLTWMSEKRVQSLTGLKSIIKASLGRRRRSSGTHQEIVHVHKNKFRQQNKGYPMKKSRVCPVRKESRYQCVTCVEKPNLCLGEIFPVYITTIEPQDNEIFCTFLEIGLCVLAKYKKK